MDFSESDRREAKNFMEFYRDKIENHLHYFRYYLSQDVILDWFGQTIKGEENVVAFIKNKITSVNHLLSDAVPVKDIGFKDAHKVKIPKDQKAIPFALMSPPRTMMLKTETKTPKKQPVPSTSFNNNNNQRELRSKYPREKGQGDGLDNTEDILTSPLKKLKTSDVSFVENLETLESECDCTESAQKLKYVVSEGCIEFHKPSFKKYQQETKWRRPCKLSAAYTVIDSNDYMIHLIIYEGNVRCRRNLMKDFDAAEPEH